MDSRPEDSAEDTFGDQMVEIGRKMCEENQPGGLSGERLELSDILRRTGVAVLVAASMVFLMQRWDALDQIGRYLSFLGFSVSLALIGVFCALQLRDGKAARALLMIAMLSVPIHFAQLGGFIYSIVPESFAVGVRYPQYLELVAPSSLAALSLVGVSLLCLIPITLFASKVFVGRFSKLLTFSLVALSAVLLIPFRHPDIVGWLGMATLFVSTSIDSLFFRGEREFQTFEGKFMRAFLFIPTALLLLRTLYLYSSSSIFVGTVMAGIGIVSFVVLPTYFDEEEPKSFLQGVSMFPMAISIFIFVDEFTSAFGVSHDSILTWHVLALSAMFFVGSRFCIRGSERYQFLGMAVLVPGFTLNELNHPSLLNSAFALLSCVGGITVGYGLKRKGVYGIGLVCLALTLLHHVRLAIDITAYSPWIILAVVGALSILASAYLERDGVALKNVVRKLLLLKPTG
ncbi:MAG: hypothetical protein KDD64_16930 [Bdellovibrionales bacterium]|nr:hypothetical protein [Bdellovibrionales bacterium]